jgi:hypothetical protein
MPGSVREQQGTGGKLEELLGDAAEKQVAKRAAAAPAGAQQVDSRVRRELEERRRGVALGAVQVDLLGIDAAGAGEIGKRRGIESARSIAHAGEKEAGAGEEGAGGEEGGVAAWRTVDADEDPPGWAGALGAALARAYWSNR